MQTKHLYVLIHIWTKGEVSASSNRLKPSSKIIYWLLKGGTFLWIFYVFQSCVCYGFVRVCLYVPCGHLLGKAWPLGSRLWCLTVSLSLSHWCSGSGVVLDCIDFWSLHPYLLLLVVYICGPLNINTTNHSGFRFGTWFHQYVRLLVHFSCTCYRGETLAIYIPHELHRK